MKSGLETFAERVPSQEKAFEMLDRLFAAAGPTSVFSAPVVQGEYVAVTAAETTIGLGYGFGAGGSVDSEPAPGADPGDTAGDGGFGTGGGGGGMAAGRPVAVIEIGPNGVRVEPIVDPTKLGLAVFTTFLGIATMLARARRR
jgi:uncharacterized spore protein YtfJ